MAEKKLNRTVKSKSGKIVNVTAEGSLGLLALGDIGLFLWREQREKDISKIQDINNQEIRN